MQNFLVPFCVFVCFVRVSYQNPVNNVCTTFLDYYKNMIYNPNCYHNPDVYLSVPEIIKRYDYPLQTYQVTTNDGYILTVFRIPYVQNFLKRSIGPPVFLQHGIAQSSMVFVNIGRRSLAFTLADNGYDVWLGNFRGSVYSNKHKYLNGDNKTYWNFTFHENGVYDLPAQLNVVTKVTNQKIIYIGYSMGSTAYFVYNTQYPEIAKNTIRISISIAPVAFLKNVDKQIKFIIEGWCQLKNIHDKNGNGGIFRRTKGYIARRQRICLPYPVKMRFCLLSAYIFGLLDTAEEDPEILPVIVMQDQDAVAMKTVYHYVQLVRCGRFQQYDYRELNDEIYGTSAPPQYNLSNINVPNFFIRANRDSISTQKNVEETFKFLSDSAKPFDIFVVSSDAFRHGDFVTARDVRILVYEPILDFLEKNKNKFL
ncbi:hypothetical protein ILUMI_06960 [Ignelater luminosus]|uniref:Lipase n=1 Tax=Ignelater luminosus TaxID=2038154 RepID=A0A8K0D4R4_IGNLU|nr:hypothetical protein ILUMI_06960 [Ignelater luminosus]